MSGEFAEQVVLEALGLLQTVRFDLERDVYLEGLYSSVSVLVRNRREDGSFHLSVHCCGPGNLQVDWDGVGIRLDEERKDNARGNRWLKIFNRNGQTDIRGKTSNQFRDFRVTASQTTVIVGRFPRRVALASTKMPGALPYYRTVSRDQQFVAEAEMYAGGKIHVIVEAQTHDLVNGIVHAELWTRTQHELDLYDIRLDQARNGRPCGTWDLDAELSDDADLRLCAFKC